MHTLDLKHAKKQIKNGRLFDAIKSYQFLLLAVIAHIYILLLVSVSAELHDFLDVSHDVVINYVAVATLIVILISRSLRWSWPLLVEDTFIVILVWILLGDLIGFHDWHHHTMMMLQQQVPEPDAVIHALSEEAAVAAVSAVGAAGATHRLMYSVAQWTQDQNEVGLELLYSLLVLAMLVCSLLTDVRNYVVSLFFRMMTVLLLVPVILLPSSCNRFKHLDLNVIILKITLYNILWYYNNVKRLTERVLENNYTTGLDALWLLWQEEQRSGDSGKGRRRGRLREARRDATEAARSLDKPATPVELLDRMKRLCRPYEEELTELTSVPRRRRRTKRSAESRGPLNPLRDSDEEAEESSDDDGDDEEDDAAEETALERETRKDRLRLMTQQKGVLVDLCQVSDSYWTRLLSWKNRTYTRNMMRVVDLVRTAWILVICPLYLVLVLLQVLWCLWHIRTNTTEIRESNKMCKLLQIYSEKAGLNY